MNLPSRPWGKARRDGSAAWRHAAALACLLALAACAEEGPPETFMPLPPALTEGSAIPVLVVPVEGLPLDQGRTLAEAIAAGLQGHDWPAGTLNPSPASRLLRVRKVGVILEAQLLSASGVMLARAYVPDRAAATPKDLGRRVADALIGATERAVPTAPGTATAQSRRRRVSLSTMVSNVDGGSALYAALDDALRRGGFDVAAADDPDSAVIAGEVFVSPAGNAQSTIEISWIVMDGSGASIGRLDQRNVVPEADLKGGLGPMAGDIVAAILPGLAQVLQASGSPAPATFTGP